MTWVLALLFWVACVIYCTAMAVNNENRGRPHEARVTWLLVGLLIIVGVIFL